MCSLLFLRKPGIANRLLLWHCALIDGLVVGIMATIVYKLLNYMVPLAEEVSATKSVDWCGLQRLSGCLDDDGSPTPRAMVSVLAGDFLLKPFRYCAPLSSPLSDAAFSQHFRSIPCA